jgi:hypothetical protein
LTARFSRSEWIYMATGYLNGNDSALSCVWPSEGWPGVTPECEGAALGKPHLTWSARKGRNLIHDWPGWWAAVAPWYMTWGPVARSRPLDLSREHTLDRCTYGVTFIYFFVGTRGLTLNPAADVLSHLRSEMAWRLKCVVISIWCTTCNA